MKLSFMVLPGVTNLKRKCLRCGIGLESYSPMRKWCFDCRKVVSLEQAKTRKVARMKLKKQKG